VEARREDGEGEDGEESSAHRATVV
jgi:hypothetical protein